MFSFSSFPILSEKKGYLALLENAASNVEDRRPRFCNSIDSDMAKIIAARGARVTILTTPVNATIIRSNINNSVHLYIIPISTAKFGLPDG
ncbi:hypothetical protein IEQ34_006931 [Dendrobium chrysotoxum]|uniref:Uncharacterized protein n=1 Tax=Dendrobium chrysotoxum TaxID=161865 RepID=A0AAV7GQM4_DENCH|nr:hypothetical protein IEQ34_006931 [Dendrobium chrysotoxum]